MFKTQYNQKKKKSYMSQQFHSQEKLKHISTQKPMNVHSSMITNSQKVETTINQGKSRQNLAYLYNEKSLTIKKR
jgi:hypothetical protein